MEGIPFLQDIHCFTFLNDEPARCKERVEKLRKNESEQGIPLAYYEGIDDIHFSIFMELMSKKLSNVLILNWGQYNDPEDVFKIISSLLSGKQKPGKVRYTPVVKRKEKDESVFIYTNDEDILQKYTDLTNDEASSEETEIWIPRNVLTNSYESKKVIADHAEPYHITFYRNEYKRVIFWHLSKFQNVTIYDRLI